jgi:hypothetical protein
LLAVDLNGNITAAAEFGEWKTSLLITRRRSDWKESRGSSSPMSFADTLRSGAGTGWLAFESNTAKIYKLHTLTACWPRSWVLERRARAALR